MDIHPDGYIVHNVTGIRVQIVSRLDGKGYDITKREYSQVGDLKTSLTTPACDSWTIRCEDRPKDLLQ